MTIFPGTLLGTGVTAVYKRNAFPTLIKHTLSKTKLKINKLIYKKKGGRMDCTKLF